MTLSDGATPNRKEDEMMNGNDMGSMMGPGMGFGWISVLLILLLLVVAIAVLLRYLRK